MSLATHNALGTEQIHEKLGRIQDLLASAQVLSAEMELRALLRQAPYVTPAWLMLADVADARDDQALVLECVAQARRLEPVDPDIGLHVAQLQVRAGRLGEALDTLEALVRREPRHFIGWLALGETLELAGRRDLAARARHQGVIRGQRAGHLMNMATTPEEWRGRIEAIVTHVNEASRLGTEQGMERMRARFGAGELRRVEQAMAIYHGQSSGGPTNPLQAPKFLFFPGLPEGPYHDPYLQPWARSLVDAFDDIRVEALAVLDGGGTGIEDFLSFQPGQSKDDYLGGDGSKPAWEAFFFYRHGQRYDANHAQAPKTAAVLEGVDLCRVANQAPEICFSVLQPGTHIKPHHGVTNTRLVMHLPLIVPADCVLNVHGGGEHVWRERELVMFDDTFRHEAWNRSGQTRVVLLMDCWNPHLTRAEQIATRHLVEQISEFENWVPEGLSRQ